MEGYLDKGNFIRAVIRYGHNGYQIRGQIGQG